MWVWREETVRGGWRLDSTGSWTYDEPARLERVRPQRTGWDVDSERLARERAAREQRARAEQRRPALAAVPPLAELEATPIFRSVAHEARSWREERRHPDERRYREERFEPRRGEREGRGERARRSIPEPHPGSGSFPAPARQRGLAPVETAPPPPPWDEERPLSAEDELRRRAERRRRPRTEPESGRHVLRR
jgi:hypothetical protein